VCGCIGISVERLTLVVVLQVQLQRRLVVRLPLLQYVGDIVVGLIRQKSAKEYQAYMSIYSIAVSAVPATSAATTTQKQQECITHIYESSFSASSMSRISMSSDGISESLCLV